MQNVYFEFNPVNEETVKGLWDNAFFVFDTNVLLNLYRYSDDTRDKFLEIMTGLGNRIWLPYQVGREFHRHRLDVISEQKQLYSEFLKRIDDIISDLENQNRNPFLSKNLCEKLISLRTDLKSEADEKIDLFDQCLQSDHILTKINSVFEGRVGSALGKDEIEKLFIEGEKRYKDLIPPGYSDRSKQGENRFGDLIIWKQMIVKASESNTPMLFITDDRKEDWWLEHKGKTISPRPELLREFYLETKHACHFYKPFQFLKYSKEFFGKNINETIIEEVKNYDTKKPVLETSLRIDLTLQGSVDNLNAFINQMKSLGYNVIFELSHHDSDYHEVSFILPNIPDLERRLTDRYLSNLDSYNIKLIGTRNN